MTLLLLNLGLETACFAALLGRGQLKSLRLLVGYVLAFDVCGLAAKAFWNDPVFSYVYWSAHSITLCLQIAVAWELCLKAGHKHARRIAVLFAGGLSFFLVVGIFDTCLRKPHEQMALGIYAGSSVTIVLFLSWLLSDFKNWRYRAVWYGLATWGLGEALCSIEARVFNLIYPALSLLAMAIFTYAAWRNVPDASQQVDRKKKSPPALLRHRLEHS